ncbi:VCBS domain-containing protein, partial [Vibrio nomapromontoriensis]
ANEETFIAGAGTPVGTTYGALTIGTDGQWTYKVDNSSAPIQSLDVGDTLTESFIVKSADGTEHTITVTVHGTEDPSIISSYEPGSVTEDTAGILTDSGDLDIADADSGEAQFDITRVEGQQNGNGDAPLGSLTITADGQWHYQVDNSLTGVQELGDGDSRDEVFRVYSIDGSSYQDIVVTIQGVDGAPTIVSGESAELTEDVGVVGNNLVASEQLVISDEDAGENVFNAGAGTSVGTTLGSLSILADGTWTYTIDNTLSEVQALDVGDTLVESFIVTSADGTEHTISVTVNGAEDETFITNYAPDSVKEDTGEVAGELLGGGKLDIADLDAGEAALNTTVTSLNNDQGQSPLGTLTILADGTWTYKVDNSLTGVQELGAGDTRIERFEVASIDGSKTQIIEVTIEGTDDAPVIAGTDIGGVTEDFEVQSGDLLKESGQLTITDTDQGESQFQTSVTKVDDGNGLTPVGTLTIDATGAWNYEIDNTDSSVQSLAEGETRTETFQVLSEDGTTHNIVITITGVNDLPSIVSGASDDATEDAAVDLDTDGNLVASNTLVISDTDANEETFIAGAGTPVGTTYGALTIGTDGQWTYKVDNSSAPIQSLDVGDTLTESFIVKSADGTEHTITVTVHGAEDPSIISSYEPGSVTEDTAGILTDSGDLDIADADSGEAQFDITRVEGQQNGNGDSPLGSLTITADGQWSYQVDNSLTGVQELGDGDSRDEVFRVYSIDGSSYQDIVVTIQGVDGAPTIVSGDSDELTEDVAVVGNNLIATEQLVISDEDAGENVFNAGVGTSVGTTLGSLSILADGTWTYTIDNTLTQVQALDVGDTLVESFIVTSADGTEHTISVTVNGAEDETFITNYVPDSVKEDTGEVAGELLGGGKLDIADLDAGEAAFNTSVTNLTNNQGQSPLGTLTILADGTWTYKVDNSLEGVQELGAGDTRVERFEVASIDGSKTQIIEVTIEGTDDAPVIAGTDIGGVIEDTNIQAGDLLKESGQLTISDTDQGESQFQTSVTKVDDGNGLTPVGTLSIDATGAWNYEIDNTDSSVQSLSEGETRTETFQVLSEDGTTHNIVITITGVNDLPSIVSGASDDATEDAVVDLDTDGNLVASNTLVISDTDANEETFIAGAGTPVGTTYGALTIGTDGQWTYKVDNSSAPIQSLDVGDTLTESFIVKSADGTEHTITVTVHGTEDPSIISSYEPGSVTEDTAGILTDSGDLDIADADSGEAQFDITRVEGQQNGNGDSPLGSLTITADGQWHYQVDNSLTGVQELGDGDSRDEVFRVYSIDGSSYQDIVVTIQGVDGAPTIVSGESAELTEDVGVVGNNLIASEQLVISDEDAGENVFNAGAGTSVGTTLGSLSILADGTWTYTIDNTLTQVQALDVGDTLVESFIVTSADGTEHTISVTVNGAEDETFITNYVPDSVKEDTGEVAGELIGGGKLDIADLDADEAAFNTTVTSLTNDQGQSPLGTLTILADGTWTYKVDNSLEGVQELGDGDTRIERFEVASIDGSKTQIIEVTIEGTDDAPVIAGTDIGGVIEDTDIQAGDLLKESGQLTITDTDQGESQFQTSVTKVDDGNGLTPVGTLIIDATGAWNYEIDNTDSSVQSLSEGETRTETFQVLSEDGTTHNIVITITGVNDLPSIVSGASDDATEDAVVDLDTDGNLVASNTLVISDTDANEETFIAGAGTPVGTTYGALTIGTDGQWTYKVDNSSAPIQSLDVGDTLTES